MSLQGGGRRQLRRSRVLRWVAGWWIGWAATGCGRGPEPTFGSGRAVEDPPVVEALETGSTGMEEAGAEDETGTSAPGANLVVGMQTLRRGLNPLGALDPWRRRVAEDLVFEGLLARSPGRRPWVTPALADRCEVDDAAAPRIVACHLTEGAVFHDGSPVKPSDVVYSLTWWLDPRRRTVALDHGLGGVSRVSVVDGPGGGKRGEDPGRWIRIDFEGPEPLALERLTFMPIVPRVLHRGREESFARAPVGSGPMRVERMADEQWTLATVPGWSRGARVTPSYDGLVLRRYEDAAGILVALRRGEVDVFPDLPGAYVRSELTRLGAARRYRAWVTSPARYDVLMLNSDAPLTSRLAMRQALTYGLRQPPTLGQVPVDLHDPVELDLDALRLDFEAAMEPRWMVARADVKTPVVDGPGALLDREGWILNERGWRWKGSDSLRVPLTWDGAGGASGASAARVRSWWRDLGVRSPFATASWGYVSSLYSQGEYTAGLMHVATRAHADLFELFHRAGRRNLSRVSDLELDAALEAYRRADDLEGRRAAQRRVAERLEQVRVVQVLRAPWEVFVTSERVRNVEFMDDLPRLDRLSLASAGQVDP